MKMEPAFIGVEKMRSVSFRDAAICERAETNSLKHYVQVRRKSLAKSS